MSSEENLCSPLLERIKQLQEKRQWYRLISSDILMDFPLPLDRGDDQPLDSECFSQVNSEMPDSTSKSPASQKQDECTGLKGNCDKILCSAEMENECRSSNMEGNTLSCRDGVDQKSVELGLSLPDKRPSAPFPYLKKGKGLARSKTKILKGFKKHHNKNGSFQSQPTSRDILPIDLEKYPRDDSTFKKLSAFEKLEALVDQDSFCSTSSKVVELLQDDSHCSSPLLQKRCLPSFPITPILMGRKPVSENGGSIQNFDVDRSRKSQTGILRSRFPCLVSPSDLKVKFLDPGVEVLEYDDDQSEKETTCNDSDVINVSDLENLALLGCKVNFVDKNLCNASSGQQFDPLFGSMDAPNLQFQPKLENIATSNREVNKKIVTKTSRSTDELEINSNKMLLLAKTNELSKEIGIFRNRNKALEELIKELNKEKQALTQKQLEYSNFTDKEKSKTKRKVEVVHRNQRTKSDFSNVVLSKKLQNLSEKLLNLGIENRNLKSKLVGLEKREKEAIKLSESERNNKDCIQKIDKKLKIETRKGESGSVTLGSLPKTKSQIRSNRAIVQGYSNAYVRPALRSSKEKQPNISFTNGSCVTKDQESKENISNPTVSLLQDDPLDGSPHFLEDSGDVSLISNPRKNSQINIRSPLTEKSNDVNSECRISSRNSKVLPNLSQETCEEPSGILDIQSSHVACVDKAKLSDSSISTSHYPNGDKKTVFLDKTVIHYVKDDVIHTIFREDGTEEISFANGQREIYFKDGSHQLMFSDGSSKTVYKDGNEVCVCKDGTVIHQNLHGTKTVHFPNGQKEIYEEGRIRRVYPDGTMKVLNIDGSQETHYPNGHVRFKDKYGNISSGK